MPVPPQAGTITQNECKLKQRGRTRSDDAGIKCFRPQHQADVLRFLVQWRPSRLESVLFGSIHRKRSRVGDLGERMGRQHSDAASFETKPFSLLPEAQLLVGA